MSTGLFDLRGIKPTATRKIHSLASLGFLIVPEKVRCDKCGQNYLLMADLAGIDPACINVFDKDDALRQLRESATAEHCEGHTKEEVVLVCELHLRNKK
jgi:hypothetical protein